MSVVTITSANASSLKTGVVLVDFYAKWCGPCKRLAPAVDRFAGGSHGSGIVFAKVDCDDNEELVTEFDIQAMPTVVLLVNGKIVVKVEGCDENDLGEVVEKATRLAKSKS